MSIIKTYDIFRTEEAVARMVPEPMRIVSTSLTADHLKINHKAIDEMLTGYFLAWIDGEEIPNCISFEYVRPESPQLRAI